MSADVLTDSDLQLETQCWKCQGSKKLVDPCDMCDGFGSRPTELGDNILNFVRRRLKLTVTA